MIRVRKVLNTRAVKLATSSFRIGNRDEQSIYVRDKRHCGENPHTEYNICFLCCFLNQLRGLKAPIYQLHVRELLSDQRSFLLVSNKGCKLPFRMSSGNDSKGVTSDISSRTSPDGPFQLSIHPHFDLLKGKIPCSQEDLPVSHLDFKAELD